MIGLLKNKQTNEKQKLRFIKRVNILSSFFAGPKMNKIMRARMDKRKALEADGCKVVDGADCNEKEKKFIAKFKAKSAADVAKELARLQKVAGDGKKMKDELKEWATQRISILSQLSASEDKYDGEGEL